ncbi:MAG: aminotransferase class IV [Planctomycetes bacterium]|nr:aminotransferase class IV [Planctomycetota bacterium]MCW8134300.1 aminotransferase class IV [Planctomycetota bacterium]
MSDYVISINGEFIPPDKASISVLDHGFLFGDSVYEVVRTVHGKLFAADRHLRRLHASAAALAMPLQRADDWFLEHLKEMHKRASWEESYLRVIVTRGVGELDLHPASCASQTVVGIAKPLPQWPHDSYAHGCKVVLANVRRNPKQATDPAIKSGNYLNNVLAIMEARNEGATEAIMMNVQGFLTECTTSNVFLVKGGVVRTPALRQGLLEGVTRGFILEVCARLGLACEEADLRDEDLHNADEVFITSTTRDVMPVGTVGERKLPFVPGPVTLKIANAYHEMLEDPANHQ